jgi:hypothetical protein
MLAVFVDLFSVILVIAVLVVAISIAHKSQARVWRLLGWFACVMALTLVIIDCYGWYRRGDWQIDSAYQFWSDINRSSLLWLGNNLPSVIWDPIHFVLQFPAWLVMILIGIALLAFDHRQLQLARVGAKPLPLRKRLMKWLRGPDEREEADKA